MKKFWMVFRMAGNGFPTAVHDSRGSANEEAERLARKHPGAQLVVLESVSFVSTDAPPQPPLKWNDIAA